MDQTIDYYNQNAENFIENTQNVDMHLAQDKFLELLPEGFLSLTSVVDLVVIPSTFWKRVIRLQQPMDLQNSADWPVLLPVLKSKNCCSRSLRISISMTVYGPVHPFFIYQKRSCCRFFRRCVWHLRIMERFTRLLSTAILKGNEVDATLQILQKLHLRNSLLKFQN